MSAIEPTDTFSVHQLAHLTRAVGLVHRARTVQEALATLTKLARELVPSERADAWLSTSEGEPSLRHAADSESGTSASDEAMPPWSHGRHPHGVIRISKAAALDLLRRADSGAKDQTRVPPYGCLAVPLVGMDDTVTGTLQLSRARDDDFTSADEILLSQFARLASQALESVRLRACLSEQESRLRLALEAANLGTWEHIPETHETYWDPRSKMMLGYHAEEVVDFERYRAALHPDDIERVFAGIAKAVDPNGTGECSLEYRIRGADGVERWLEAHGRCVFDERRKPVRINGTLLDISARKAAEDALRESSRRKDEFLALLGHELRNPLAPIRTALELMRQRSPEHGVREREVIERQLRHMMRLVDDLLDVSRIARGTVTLRRESLPLDAVVLRAVEMASPLLEERAHHLHVDVPNGLFIDADADRLAQVVANLLTNAARYTAPSGRISVHAAHDEESVLLHIKDNGIGLREEDLNTIFEPFVQAASLEGRQGLGLGLPLVRDLVRLHGGAVEAHSAGPGQGSCFTVRLPRSNMPDAQTRTNRERPHADAPTRRVLLVDDNVDAAELLGMFLENRGHSVSVAFDGPEALEQAQRFLPEIAILDLALPVMDGFELAERLRGAYGKELRLIALTGYGQPEDRERTRAAGFDVHLVKPVDMQELELALATSRSSL